MRTTSLGVFNSEQGNTNTNLIQSYKICRRLVNSGTRIAEEPEEYPANMFIIIMIKFIQLKTGKYKQKSYTKFADVS